MRVVFVGATELAVATARLLIAKGHDVIIVERDKEVIENLRGDLDCGFLLGDGTKPKILREADPEQAEFLFCLTRHAQENIIASLVGRSLGFKRVITSIDDLEFLDICEKLGLEHTIVPSQTIGRHLADIVRGVDVLELSTLIKGDARFFSFTAGKEEAGPIGDLDLPELTKIVFVYRDDEFMLLEEHGKLQNGDEVVMITHSRNLPVLQERWQPTTVIAAS